MLYVNRDAVGLPDLAADVEMLAEMGTARVVRSEKMADGTVETVIQVEPVDSTSFSVRFYPPALIACDGTLEQCAQVGLLLGRAARTHGVRMVALTEDAGRAHSLEEDDTVEGMLSAEWTPIDANEIGAGDLLA